MGNKNKVLLKDICNVITKGTTPSQFSEKGINFIRIENINGLNIDSNFDMFISEKIHNTDLKRSILKKNDILFAIAGATVGKCAIVNEDCLPANTNQALAIIRLKNNYDSFYIANILASEKMKKYIYLNISVGAQPNLSLEQIGNFQFYVDDIVTQTKIATFLNLYYKKIELQKKKVDLLKLQKHQILNDIFKLDNKVNYIKLNKLLNQISIKNKNNLDVPVLSVSNKFGFIPQSEQFEEEVASEDKSNYKLVKLNQFAYNPARINVGSIAKLINPYTCGQISPMYICFECDSTLNSDYFGYYLQSSTFKKEMQKRLEGSVRMCLTFESMCNIKMTLPVMKKQLLAIDNLKKFDLKIKTEETKLLLLEKYKQGLLQKMFI